VRDYQPVAGECFLYLTTRGRRSGEPRRIEIWFVALEDKWYVVAELRERAGWVKNLRADPQVTFSVGVRDDDQSDTPTTHALARALDEDANAALARKVRTAMDAKYGWSDGLIVELTPEVAR